MAQPTWIGRSLNGRYKIDALLGKGGMSAVYKAFDPNLKRIVAVKLIHSHLADDEDFIYRFKKEAASVAAFRHPNIVQVYDFNADDELYYMVLEFVPGETLQDRLKQLKKSNANMPLDQAIHIVIDICSALGYAHNHGTIHRDIKPANIMLNLQGQAILMDFGIVKIMSDTSHTATGAVVGTARYMSPEVIRSEAPDERSDVYSLGVTLYEMLSGEPPFSADSAMSLLMQHLNDPVPDISSLRSDIPSELIQIVNKALEKDRANRYASTNEMASDLKRVLAALETDSAPTASPAPKTDPAIADTKKTTNQIEDKTEPWNISTPSLPQDDSIFDEPTTVDEPQLKMDKTTPGMVEPPKQETVKAGPKLKTKPVASSSMSPLIKFGGAGVIGLFLIIGGWFAFRNVVPTAPEPTLTSTPTATQPANTATTIVNTDTPAFTPTEEPTATLEPTPTSTLPPLYVRINDITINASNLYVVEYETFGYTEQLPGQHIHFFFNTVPFEQAGSPGSGPWKIYGGPRPFTGYGVSNRPADATQMCALVANANHSIILESGNCFDLPK